MRIHYLQHIPLENPGSILAWADEKSHALTCTRFYENDAVLPDQQDFDWLIIMGGPMNIYEEHKHPWLAAEKQFIRQSIDSGKVVLGICLGAQLIADVIGGKVTTNEYPEIGWFPIRWVDGVKGSSLFSFFPEEPVVFHWHYDTFSELPDEAEVIAESEGCLRQAFVYRERVYGFQFHMENTPELVHGYIAEGGHEMKAALYVQTPEEVLAGMGHLQSNNLWMASFLTRLEEATMQEVR